MGDYNIDNALLVNPYEVLACLFNTSYTNIAWVVRNSLKYLKNFNMYYGTDLTHYYDLALLWHEYRPDPWAICIYTSPYLYIDPHMTSFVNIHSHLVPRTLTVGTYCDNMAETF
jgi:hypothetical protein